jgi:hypothetical protein
MARPVFGIMQLPVRYEALYVHLSMSMLQLHGAGAVDAAPT